MPMIVEEYIPAPGTDEKATRVEHSGDYPTGESWMATKPEQMAASQAAQEAITAGKSKDEIFKAAKSAYDEVKQTKSGRSRLKEKNDPAPATGLDRQSRYLKAVAQLGSGKFDNLTYQELADVVLLVKQEYAPFDAWASQVAELEGIVSE